MPKFTYIGETANGEAVKETVEATDRFAVYDIARTNGHTVSKVETAKKFSIGNFFNMEKINYFLGRVKNDELSIYTRNLSSMLRAGLPLTRALSVLERQSKNAKLSGIVKRLQERINKGDQFHEGLGEFPKTFSKLYISMVRAGEESGKMSDALEVLSIQLERASNMKKKIKGAMIYPSIVIIVMLVLGILMIVYVMPTITATFVKLNVDLPVTTRTLIWVSDFVTQNGVLTLFGIILSVIGLVTVSRTKPGQRTIHFGLIHLPIIGTLVKETNSARTARTLSSLLASGVDVIHAIEITGDVVQNVYYKEVLVIAAEVVKKGDPMSSAFTKNEHLYPVLVGEMIAVGEETGQISEMLKEVAVFYENEIEMKTKDLSTIIEPVLMVFIGAAVGFFALAMIAPIYSISDSI